MDKPDSKFQVNSQVLGLSIKSHVPICQMHVKFFPPHILCCVVILSNQLLLLDQWYVPRIPDKQARKISRNYKLILIPAFCDYWRFGTGGHQENVNAVCILALNIINDKVIKIHWLLSWVALTFCKVWNNYWFYNI